MNLSLLAPAALALGALVLGPVLAHLAQQRPSERQAYGAMLLLRRLVRRLEKRRRLKDRWLLAARALGVLLLALAAAQPRLTWPGDAPRFGGTGAVVLVVDDSLSMGLREGGRSRAAAAAADALEILDGLPAGARVGLVRIGGEARRFTPTLTEQRSELMEQLKSIDAVYGATDLQGGLREARALLEGQPGEVLVFTDEAGPTTVSAAVAELGRLVDRGAAVVPRVHAGDPPRNLAVVGAEYGDGLEGGSVLVRTANYGPEPLEAAVTVGLPDGSEITAFVEVPAGGVAEERFTVPLTVPGGVAWARVQDEDLPQDNTRYFHLPRVGASRVLVVDGDPGASPVRSEVYFLERALAPWGAARGGVMPEIIAPGGLGQLDPAVHQVVFLCNVGDPGPWSGRLVDFVRGGGGLVISAGDNLTADRYNGALRELLPAPLDRPRDLVDLSALGGDPLELPDVALPLFRPFARDGRGAFGRIHARRVMALRPYSESPPGEEGGVRTLLRTRGGAPALVEREVGRGRVLVWTGTFDLGWGNAPLQAVFMPFVQRLVGYLGGESAGSARRGEATVGQPFALELPSPGTDPQLFGPGGQPVSAELRRGEQLELRFTPQAPGAYELRLEQGPPLALIAVNTPVEESDVRPGQALAEAEAAVRPELLSRTAELGPWASLVALALLLAQSVWSARRTE